MVEEQVQRQVDKSIEAQLNIAREWNIVQFIKRREDKFNCKVNAAVQILKHGFQWKKDDFQKLLNEAKITCCHFLQIGQDFLIIKQIGSDQSELIQRQIGQK